MVYISKLQKNIIDHLKVLEQTDYKSLMILTKRNRITIYNSIESLIIRGYVEKIPLNPKHEKSKLVFKLTDKYKKLEKLELLKAIKIRIDNSINELSKELE